MIQRIQTIYLLLALCLCVGCLCTPVAHFVTLDTCERVDMYNLWLVNGAGEHTFFFCPALMGLMVITATLLFFDIWLFTRRALQMRLAVFCMILLVGWYALYAVIAYMLTADMDATFRPNWTAALPAAALIFTYLAFRGILKDEMLVRSLDRLR